MFLLFLEDAVGPLVILPHHGHARAPTGIHLIHAAVVPTFFVRQHDGEEDTEAKEGEDVDKYSDARGGERRSGRGRSFLSYLTSSHDLRFSVRW